MPQSAFTPRSLQYLRVFALGFSAFIFNTTEFVPVGLLSDIAQDFDMSVADAGWMLTIYAWIVASMSLPMMLITSQIERKSLLIGVFSVFIISHIGSALAWNFTSLMISRAGIAFAHAVFWSITASIVIRVAPASKKTFALSMLATGTSLAMILGVPFGRMIGQWFGWRVTFAVIAFIAVMILLALIRLLPKLPSLFSGSFKTVPLLLRNPMLVGMYGFTFLLFAGHYSTYSYIEPFLQQIAQVSADFTTLVLLVFGGAGIVGSILFSYLGEKHNTRLLFINLWLVFASLAILFLCTDFAWALMTVAIIWSAAFMVATLCMQVKILALDANAVDMIQSMYSGIINLGIGAGALIGGQVIWYGHLSWIGYAGASLVLLSLMVITLLLQRYSSLR